MTRVAAIDCGTNTIRLLIADITDSGASPALAEHLRLAEIVRLGQGVDRTGRLDDGALARTLAVVDTYAEHCREYGVDRMRFVATSATRDASNREVFVEGVRQRLGIDPEVVSGEEEARLSFAGSSLCLAALAARAGGSGAATSPEPCTAPASPEVPASCATSSAAASLSLPALAATPALSADATGATIVPRPHLVVDLGGGSTELVLGVREPQAAFSMNTGSVRVTERYLADGVTPAGEAAARTHVRALLEEASSVVNLSAAGALVGLAGTITTVTAHALGLTQFDPQALDGATLPAEQMLASCEAIIHSTAAERESWGYLRPGRRDVIAAGALVWSEVIRCVVARTADGVSPVTHCVTSLKDILDGIALSMGDETSW